jgi:hypothetical protein
MRMAWVRRRPRICTHGLPLRKPSKPASPFPPLPFLGAAPRPSPAGASAGHRLSGGHQSATRPRIPTPPPHQSKRPYTHARTERSHPPARRLACHPAPCPHPPRPSLTPVIRAPVHVELAPRRREAVTNPGRRRGAAEGGGEVCPGPGGRIVHVCEVIENACAGRAGGATAARRSRAGRAARLRTHAWLAAAACAAAEYPAPSRRLK